MIIDTSNWGWPQWSYLTITVIAIVLAAAEHGEPKTGNFNFGTFMLSIFVAMFLLVSGGFFK